MAHALHLQRYRKKCQHCGEMFGARTRDARYCSNRCSFYARGPEWWRAHQAKCIATRKARGYSRFVRRMKVIGLTDAQIASVRREVETARAAGHVAGKRNGWAEALGEKKGRAA